MIERLPLVRSVDSALTRKLVLLLAPLGSGKTTLLHQWFARAGARRIAWLLCDERDNEPARFFVGLATAIGRAISRFDAGMSSRASERVRYSSEHIAGVLLDKLSAIPHELTIVIDDFQWITDPDLNHAFSCLVLRSAPNVHWIVASRQVPHLDLGRLKLEDQLTVIGSAELNFRPEHVRELARLLRGVELSALDAVDCCRRTEGWIAGVKLALLSAAETTELGIGRFSWFNHDIVSYLAEAVLDAQPPDVRQFLLASCVVDRMNGELCNALLGIEHAAALLENLERSQLFVQPLDAEHRWFRYHALFLEFLRNTLGRDAPERIAGLHKTASLWFAEHELIEEALHHAFAIDEREWCLELIARCVPAWLRTGEFDDVLQWTAHLSTAEIIGCEAIRTAHLMSLIFSRQFERANAVLTACEHLESPSARDLEWHRTLEIFRMLLAIMSDAAPMLTMQQIERLAVAVDPYLTANLLNVAGYHMLVKRKFDLARRLALRGQALLEGTSHAYTLAQSQIVLVLVDQAQGHARAAAQSCMQLYARAKDGRRNPTWVTAATAAASVHYHQNRLQQAEALCAEVLPLLAIAPSMENFTIAHVIAARLKCAAGKHGEGLRLLDHLHSVLESVGYQRRLLARVCFEKVRIWLLDDQLVRAVATLSDFDMPCCFDTDALTPGALDEAREQLTLSNAAIAFHQGDFDRAIALFETLRRKLAADGYVYGRIRAEAALATCHWYARDEETAFALINGALLLTQERGFSRAVFDDVAGLPRVFSTAVKRARLETLPSSEYFRKFHDVLACNPYGAGPIAAPSAALTQRELDLLQLLSLGLSNRDISARCNITLFTTKWHLKNVFAKLGVSTRMEALFRAQQMQLLSGGLLLDAAPHAQARMGWREMPLRRAGDSSSGARRNAGERDLLAGKQSESSE